MRLAIDQALIGASRILWERIMNMGYYLGTEEDIETKVSKNKTKTKLFREFAKRNPPWDELISCLQNVEEYCDKYRTPEFHKGSVLRTVLTRNKEIDGNELLSLLNLASNRFNEILHRFSTT